MTEGCSSADFMFLLEGRSCWALSKPIINLKVIPRSELAIKFFLEYYT